MSSVSSADGLNGPLKAAQGFEFDYVSSIWGRDAL